MVNKYKMDSDALKKIMTIERKETCCFTGHREIPKSLNDNLYNRVMDGVNYLYRTHNIKTFLAGGAVGFDTVAAQAVLKCREANSDIRLIIVIPCQNQARYWSHDEIDTYERINELADRVICLSEHYHRGCMHQRNRYLVDNSRACICYLTRDSGGTAYTVKYAQSKGLRIINLAQSKGGNA